MKILAILGVLQGIILLSFFLSVKKNKVANRNMLIAILLSIGQMLLVFYIENPLDPNGPIYLKLLTRILVFPIPVFFYFYFRFLVTGAKTYHKKDWVHVLPFLIATIAAYYPYLNIDHPKSLLTSNDNDALSFAQEGLHFMFFQSIVIIFYAKLSFYSIFDLQTKVLDIYSGMIEKELKWLAGAILGIFLVGLSGAICAVFGLYDLANSTVQFNDVTNYIYIVFGVVSISFYWISYKAIQQPEIFRDFDHFFEKKEKEKYKHSAMSVARAEPLAEKLLALMANEQLYLNPNLKLTDIANRLHSSNKILSQLINQHFEQNFYDFVNSYRVKAAKAKLLDANYAHLSIQGIAIESGFKSKSTFYSLFKKETGLTPLQFQKKIVR